MLHDTWTPVIIDGIVVTGGKTGSGANRPGVAVGVDLNDGAVRWRLENLDDRPEATVLQRVVTDGRLAVTVLGDVVYALDPASGRPRWTTPLGDALSSYFQAWAIDELVVVSRTTRGFNTWAGTGSYTVALDAVSGVERWRFDEGTVALASLADGTLVHVLPVPYAAQEPARPRRYQPGRRDSSLVGRRSPRAGLLRLGRVRRHDHHRCGRRGGGIRVRRPMARCSGGRASTGSCTTQPVVIDRALVVAGQQTADDLAFVRAYDLTDGTVGSEWTGTAGSPVALGVLADGELTVAVDPADNTIAGRLVAVRLGLESGPEDTSALFGIPTPTEALTAKKRGLRGRDPGPSDGARGHPDNPVQHCARTAPGEAGSRSSRPDAHVAKRGPAVELVAAYTVLGAVMFSLLEPEWGANPATVVTGASFWVVLVVFMALGIAATARQERVRYGTSTGRPVLSFKTLFFAALCVGGSRAIAFVPGFLYGVIVSYRTETKFSDRDEADIARLTVSAGFLLAIAACTRWPVRGHVRNLGSAVPADWRLGRLVPGRRRSGPDRPASVAPTPGATLRRHHPIFWKALWAMSGFLFVLALLRPGLASAHSRSTGLILVGAAVYGGIAVVFWGLTTRHAARVDSVGANPAPTDEPPRTGRWTSRPRNEDVGLLPASVPAIERALGQAVRNSSWLQFDRARSARRSTERNSVAGVAASG